MKKKSINVFIPKYLINNLNRRNDFIFSLINITHVISSFDQEFTINLESGESPKFIIYSKKKFDYELFTKILSNGYLDLFSRGNIRLNTSNKSYYFDIEKFLKPSLQNSNILDIYESQNKNNLNSLEINKILTKDIIFWNKIDEYNICLNTLIGFNKNRSIIYFNHTGQPKTFISKSRQQVWANNNENIHDTFHFSPETFEGSVGKIKFILSISFKNETEDELIINDSKSFYKENYSKTLKKEFVQKLIRQNLTPRLTNYARFFLEIDTNQTTFSNYYGYISDIEFSNIKELLLKFINKIISDKNYQKFLDKIQKTYIDQEDKDLKKRKVKASIRRNVYFVESNNKKNFLIKVPENEQEVVLLTSILASKKLYFINFEFLDYLTAKGIDSIINFKIFEGDKSFEAAVVEFKLKLESFTDERHPINLIDLVIAWDLNPKKFSEKPFVLEKTTKRGLYFLESKKSHHKTMALVLREIDGIIIK